MRRSSSRRAFLTMLGTVAAVPVILSRHAFAQNPPARVDATALRQRIEALSQFGRAQAARSAMASVGSPIRMPISPVADTSST